MPAARFRSISGLVTPFTPSPEEIEYPVILQEFATPKLRAYPRYTVVAEKFEALASLGIANSRMKDYFDLWILAQHTEFRGDVLCKAIKATFGRRQTILNAQVPLGLSDEFAKDDQKQMQWQAFLRKNKLQALSLCEVIGVLTIFLQPVFEAASSDFQYLSFWQAGGPWMPESAHEQMNSI